ncbi:MAG: signal peptidase I [Oscillospiraceae bacterium]|nr:signal peptidase I [Oscillospiraceae bacterium]
MSEKKEVQQLEIPSVDLLEGELKRTRYNARYRRTLRTTIFSLLLVAAAAVIIAVLLLPVLQISSGSMENTLVDGDMVISLNNGKYKTGDIIGFYYNNVVLIKRVIATSGDWVDIAEDGTVTVNGVVLDEPYVEEKALGDCNIKLPYQVPQGKCFVLGDNRTESVDSRNTAVGCISNDVVLGKLLARIWPLKSFTLLN